MPTANDDYARRFADWQQREAAARSAALQRSVEANVAQGRNYQSWEYQQMHRELALNTISNRLASETVLAAHHEASRRGVRIPYQRGFDYLENTAGDSEEGRQYRDWVRHKLENSGLAKMVPGGLIALPNIFEAMPERWRAIERLNQPRNYKQLVTHLARYLDWYLQPSSDLAPPPFQITTVLTFIGILLACVVPYVGVLIVIIFLLVANARKKKNPNVRRPHNFYSPTALIHAAELYYYLLESYADQADLPSPDESDTKL